MFKSTKRRRRLGIVALALVIFAAGAIAAGATIRSQMGGIAVYFKAVDADHAEFTCTGSTTFVDMPGMAVTFDPYYSWQRVLAFFQGEWRPPPSNSGNALIRLVIDGVVQSGPGGDLTVNRGEGIYTNGFNFISNPLSSSPHTAKIQWRTQALGDTICVEDRSFIIEYY